MKSTRRPLVTAALLALFASATLAQAPGTPPAASAPGMQGHTHGHRHDMKEGGRSENRHEQHLADLKNQLQLKPEQEAAWTQFRQAMGPMTGMQHPDREALAKLSTPQRIDQMRAMRQQQIAQMDRKAEATKTFYAALTPEQKKRFDDRMVKPFGRHGGGHRGSHHG